MSIMPESMQAEDIYSQLAMVNGLSDQQLQQLQQNPSLGWMAGIVASERAQARIPTPPAPQGTVIGSKLAQLQQGGIPAGMMNQQALQANPMSAGIAGAPENIPGAATGGIVALAEGGSVRGFAGGTQTLLTPDMQDRMRQLKAMQGSDFQYSMTVPEDTTPPSNRPFESMKRIGSAAAKPFDEWAIENAQSRELDPTTAALLEEMPMPNLLPSRRVKEAKAAEPKKEVDEETGAAKTPKAEPTKEQKEGIKSVAPKTEKVAATDRGIPAAGRQTSFTEGAPGYVGPARQTGVTSLQPPGAGAGNLYRTINDPSVSSEQTISAISEALGAPYAMSAELKGKMEKAQAEAEQGRWVRAGLSALGTTLSAPTEHLGKALGMGLVAGVNQFQQETDPEKLRNLMLQGEAAEDEAKAQRRHETGLEYLKQQAARSAKTEEHQFQLLKQSISDRARLLAAEIKASGAATTPQELEDKLVEKLVGIYGTTLPPSEIRATARQLAQAGGGGTQTAGSAPIGRLTSSGLQIFNQPS